MDGTVQNIIKNSKRRLTRLKLLSNFFENYVVISMYVKTEIIHDTFLSNNYLDISKLELFHLQYTDSLIELLTQLKKKKENEFLSIINEISINKKYIDQYTSKDVLGNFEIDRKFYSSNFSKSLQKIYNDFSENKMTSDWNEIQYFKNLYETNYYRITKVEDFVNLTMKKKYYSNAAIQIERKLLGILNINNFKVRFLCGYKVGESIFELFRIFNTDDEHFIYDINGQKMFFILQEEYEKLDTSVNIKNENPLVTKLSLRNKELKNKKNKIRKEIKEDVLKVLEEYLINLENLNLLTNLFNIDEQKNILKAMLNLNLNN